MVLQYPVHINTVSLRVSRLIPHRSYTLSTDTDQHIITMLSTRTVCVMSAGSIPKYVNIKAVWTV